MAKEQVASEKIKTIQDLDTQFLERARHSQGYILDFGVIRPPILPSNQIVRSYPVSQAGLFSFKNENGILRTVALKISPDDHVSGLVPNIAMPGHHLISKEFQDWAKSVGYVAGLPLFGYVRPLDIHEPASGVIFNPQYSFAGEEFDGEHVEELSVRIPSLVIYLGQGAIYRAGVKKDLHEARSEINN